MHNFQATSEEAYTFRNDQMLRLRMRRFELDELPLGVLKAIHAISGRMVTDPKGRVSSTQSPVPLHLLAASEPACICGSLLYSIATVSVAAACSNTPMRYSPRGLICMQEHSVQSRLRASSADCTQYSSQYLSQSLCSCLLNTLYQDRRQAVFLACR